MKFETEWNDPEFQSWSPDAQYLFQERLGMLCADKPYRDCDEEAIEIAKGVARKFEFERALPPLPKSK